MSYIISIFLFKIIHVAILHSFICIILFWFCLSNNLVLINKIWVKTNEFNQNMQFISLWLLFKTNKFTIEQYIDKVRSTWLLAWLSLSFFCRCNLNSEHSSSMTSLTLIIPYIRPFFGESQNLMVHKLLYHGFENPTILGRVPLMPSMASIWGIRIMPCMIRESGMKNLLRHNESLLDKVR